MDSFPDKIIAIEGSVPHQGFYIQERFGTLIIAVKNQTKHYN
jgi:hypothetical protein